MIYLVSKQQKLFDSDKYECISPDKALSLLASEKILGADTETTGLDPYECKLLTIQLGNEKFQIVWDCISYPVTMLKDLLERKDILFIWHSYTFDSSFLLKEGIVQKNFIDTLICERLLCNGLTDYKLSLKACALKYCNYDMDKSARGDIITKGLTESTIVYSGTDVAYSIPIYEAQLKELEFRNLVKAAKFESTFTIVAGYFKLCGVKLDVNKWNEKIKLDKQRRDEAEIKCNKWVEDYYKEHNGNKGYIELRCLTDTTFIHPKSRNKPKDLVFKELPYEILRLEKEPSKEYGTLFYTIYKVPFGYYKKSNEFISFITNVNAVQLDLFSNSSESFGDKCTISWSSSKQLIPLFELLGFKLDTFNKTLGKTTKSVGAPIISAQMDKSTLAPLYLKFKEADTVCNSFGDKFIKALSKDGRLRGDWRSIGTDTLRMSCKGNVHGQNINMQQLPSDAITRASFISEKGNLWVSCDMSGQESRVMASLANDKNMMELLDHGDIHSYVARVSFNEIPNDYPIELIKKDFHQERQNSKKVEFSIAYGGDANTIKQRIKCSDAKAKSIYDAYMNEFPSVKEYQTYCANRLVIDKYILMDNVTLSKCYIPEADKLFKIHNLTKTDEFWEEYDISSELQSDYKWYKKTFDDYVRKAINYRIQRRGSGCLKYALILFFKYIVEHDLLNTVLFTVAAHDELNFEAPKSIAEDLAKKYQECVLLGSKPFCPNIDMLSDVSYLPDGNLPTYWIH
jgi:DNA polymerase I-like protein with 3'-5' exonuclease and polymerase domains